MEAGPRGLAFTGTQRSTNLSIAAMRKRLTNHEVTERKQVGDAESLMNEEAGSTRMKMGGEDAWLE